MNSVPEHLQKYIVTQNYEKYTALEHAVWRYVLRQLKKFLHTHAHESYIEGLEKTGISVEQIPEIKAISKSLEKFGWRALPVSGFIPPAAFMELQSLSILPIASDMRSINHLLYTPAPDIVHEAAGHAPIIANIEYANYLKQYADVAKHAIISNEDLDLYKAIRELSDLKESPNSTDAEIKKSENNLLLQTKSVSFISEATKLSRMNWWTAEYGLIGPLSAPKIFGAGLLSSIAESRWCLTDKVKKIPLTLDCINQTYDITEPQPQLYVARDFKHLSSVLNELSETMAYKTGGLNGLQQAQLAKTINTVQLDTGFQISGLLKNIITDTNNQPIYLQFTGPTQLAFNNKQIDNHGTTYHSSGYGTAIGQILNFNLNELKINNTYELNYQSGVKVSGELINILSLSENSVILSFKNATSSFNNTILFEPDWGIYDIIIGNTVTSVFGGPADRNAYGQVDDFIAAQVNPPKHNADQINLFSYYQEIRKFRSLNLADELQIHGLFKKYITHAPNEWLLFLEILEIAIIKKMSGLFCTEIKKHLAHIEITNSHFKELISEGLILAHEQY